MSDVPASDDPDTTDPALGADTLLGVLDEARRHGYVTQQVVRGDDAVGCEACGITSAPAAFGVSHFRRLEGSSDAADLVIVIWSTCPRCAARGTLVLGYGPNADAHDDAVLRSIDLDGADASPTDAS